VKHLDSRETVTLEHYFNVNVGLIIEGQVTKKEAKRQGDDILSSYEIIPITYSKNMEYFKEER
jgi:hypothetical protein